MNNVKYIKPIIIITLCIVSVITYIQIIPLLFNINIPFPKDLNDIKEILKIIEKSSKGKEWEVFIVYSIGYLIKQSYASGALYGHYKGFILVNILSSVGSTLCYFLSFIIGKDFVLLVGGDRLKKLQVSIKENKSDLVYYLLMLRLFPFTPNWFLNIASPHLKIPVDKFFISIFLGLAPYNFVTTGAGTLIHEIESINDILKPGIVLKLLLISIALIPSCIYFKRKYTKDRID